MNDLQSPGSVKELSIAKCIDRLECLLKNSRGSDYTYQLEVPNSPFNTLKRYLNAVINGVFMTTYKGEIIYVEPYELSLGYHFYSNEYEAVAHDWTINEGYEFGLLCNGELLSMEDYGKYWALTEGELR